MNFSKKYFLLGTAVVLGCLFLALQSGGVKAQNSPERKNKVLRTVVVHPHKNICGIPGDHLAKCHAKVSTQDDGVTPLAGASPYASSLTPAAFHNAYQLPCTPGGSVSSTCIIPSSFGPTIAIVDAYHSPTIENDLNVYSSYYGLPSCTKANGCLQVVDENGGNNLPLTVNSGWALETSLDVEVAHAICQTCKILLVEATTNSFLDLATGVNSAVNLGAVSVSNSYGAGEWNGESFYDSYYNHPGVAVTVSSGDGGYGTEYPAASSGVIAVGGTTLNLFTDLTYASESVWNGAGSGCSSYESANSWQTSLSNWILTNCGTKRGITDISADADPNTGAAIYDSTSYSGQTGWWQIGGTSLSSPLIASAFAMGAPISPSSRAASVLYANYNPSNYHDVVSGSNGLCTGIMCIGATGYDGPTGLGSPNGLGAFGVTNIATPTPTLTPTPTATPTPTLTPTPTPIDSTPPTVAITNPLDGSRVFRNNTITIRATASDNVAVQRVEFYINGNLLSTDFTSAYTASWHVPSPRGVVYTITAKAYDTSNNSASSSVTVTSR